MNTAMKLAPPLRPQSILLGLKAADAAGLLQELVDGLVANNTELAPRRAELLGRRSPSAKPRARPPARASPFRT
jgi:hypothetical protein